MEVSIRPARQEDQETIVSFINQAKLNPLNIHWQHFLVAKMNGKVVGIRQVKVYPQGTREGSVVYDGQCEASAIL